jgi:hypothetical protein
MVRRVLVAALVDHLRQGLLAALTFWVAAPAFEGGYTRRLARLAPAGGGATGPEGVPPSEAGVVAWRDREA